MSARQWVGRWKEDRQIIPHNRVKRVSMSREDPMGRSDVPHGGPDTNLCKCQDVVLIVMSQCVAEFDQVLQCRDVEGMVIVLDLHLRTQLTDAKTTHVSRDGVEVR